METLHISTHHCKNLANSYQTAELSRYDAVRVGKADTMYQMFAENKTLRGKVSIEENRDCETIDAAGMFTNCTGLTAFPTADGGYRRYKFTQGMFRGCSNLTGFCGWSVTPELCQRMFFGCSSWDGKGVNLLDFSKTVHPNSMLEICKGVSLSDSNLAHLLRRIRDTTPAGATRWGVHVGHGPCSALTSRLMDSIDSRIEIFHDGPREVWDYDFDHEVGVYVTEGAKHYTPTTVSFDGITGLDGHFKTPYNGCLISPNWGVFAAHYLPPIGFQAVTMTGEVLTVDKRVNGPGDLAVCRFRETARTTPVTVLGDVHAYLDKQGYAEEAFGSGVPVFSYDQTEKPRVFELYNLEQSAKAANIGPAINIKAPGGMFSVGDSGSIFFVVNAEAHALAVSEVHAAGGAGTSIGLCKDWIEGVTGQPLRIGT